jgi:hypothetical protein
LAAHFKPNQDLPANQGYASPAAAAGYNGIEWTNTDIVTLTTMSTGVTLAGA